MTRPRRLMGVDPGKGGAVALLDMASALSRPRLLRVVNANALLVIAGMAKRADVIVIERQQASAQQGRSSVFSLGYAAGLIDGVLLLSATVEVTRVSPVTWRTSFGLSDKASGVDLVAELLDHDDGRLITRHDEADAVLLAWWGWRHVALAGADAC